MERKTYLKDKLKFQLKLINANAELLGFPKQHLKNWKIVQIQ